MCLWEELTAFKKPVRVLKRGYHDSFSYAGKLRLL